MFPNWEPGTEDDFPAGGNHIGATARLVVCVCGPFNRRGAVSFSREVRLTMTAAFRRAWKTLLVEERITAQNIEFIPTILMEAIVDATHASERDELLLASAALVRMANHERDELDSGLR